MAEASNYQAPAGFDGIRNMALGVGGVFFILWLVGTYFNVEQGLRSWLLGFIFWGGITIGSLGIIMLQYLTGGAWGVVIRRIVEAGSRTLPVVFIFFLPLLFGVTHLYEWTHLPPDDITMIQRGWYQTPQSWILRSVVYFVLFAVMTYLLNKWSANQDKSADYEESARWLGKATAFSGPALVIYALLVTFATVDWVMSLDPHWFSTIWGLLFVAGWALATFSFAVILLAYMSDKEPMQSVIGKRHFHDLGKLMLALTMVWAYFNFSQFLIIYSGNIPEETVWYILRMKGGWGWMGVILILFHFAFPFLILLQQDFKRKAKLLASMAGFILVMRLIDMYFLIGPTPRIETHGKGLELGLSFSWLDIVAPLAIGGFWLAAFFYQLKKRAIVPVMDPFFENAIHHGKGH
ncbi:MAG: hypothetical protein QUS14_11040 [Pyrinomonadaceae bacterium]|nr:hypothetical protein [Pyrinomonadaceae bacterium]